MFWLVCVCFPLPPSLYPPVPAPHLSFSGSLPLFPSLSLYLSLPLCVCLPGCVDAFHISNLYMLSFPAPASPPLFVRIYLVLVWLFASAVSHPIPSHPRSVAVSPRSAHYSLTRPDRSSARQIWRPRRRGSEGRSSRRRCSSPVPTPSFAISTQRSRYDGYMCSL